MWEGRTFTVQRTVPVIPYNVSFLCYDIHGWIWGWAGVTWDHEAQYGTAWRYGGMDGIGSEFRYGNGIPTLCWLDLHDMAGILWIGDMVLCYAGS